ncbi:cbb3-type cytochrome c oxidase subunit I, partial [Candidatus Saccharibacteria bacterium]|nr:cbb3-type cytochrome c oxidase subunit I [Candidatus Saccharibacteria bacterium]
GFTMGAGANVNAFFGVMTMAIAVPTGVKIFNWLFTMYGGRVRFTTPMLWFMGFVATFTVGGVAGVIMAIPPADFQLHNSLFLVAHFHTMIIGGVVFGYFAGLTYWFPKFFGFKLNERLGRYAFYGWFFGFLFAFVPLYILGLMGATRRLDHYDASLGWQWLFIVAAFGVGLVLLGIGFQVLQLIVSIRQRHQNIDITGDPWNGRTLEWSTVSPPTAYNFAQIPDGSKRDAYWQMKKDKTATTEQKYESFLMPRNTIMPAVIGALGFAMGFGMIWHMYWLAIIGVLAIVICLVVRTSVPEHEYVLGAAAVRKNEEALKERFA